MPTIKKAYLYTVGRRKCASARVRYYKKGEGKILINEHDYKEYFPTPIAQKIMLLPLEKTKYTLAGDVTIKVVGGGKKGQAECISLGLARLLQILDPELRKPLKKAGLLTRDARIKERKKPGLKRARRAPQWSKR